MGKYICNKLKILCLVIKKVVRLTCGAQTLDHTSSLFYDFSILKFPDMVKQKTAEIMYKAFNNSLPNNMQKLFVLYDTIYTTRLKCVFKHFLPFFQLFQLILLMYKIQLCLYIYC